LINLNKITKIKKSIRIYSKPKTHRKIKNLEHILKGSRIIIKLMNMVMVMIMRIVKKTSINKNKIRWMSNIIKMVLV
jgi:hypothetical protein